MTPLAVSPKIGKRGRTHDDTNTAQTQDPKRARCDKDDKTGLKVVKESFWKLPTELRDIICAYVSLPTLRLRPGCRLTFQLPITAIKSRLEVTHG